MAEAAHPHLFPSISGRKAELAVGLAAAVLAATFVCAHWSIALIAAPAILVLSATENEGFLLFVIFLIPISWVLSGDALLHNVPDALRFLVTIGFFSGRIWRGRTDWKRLDRSPITRASFVFLIVIIVSGVFGSVRMRDSIGSIFEVVSFLGFFLLLLAWIDTRERLEKVLEVVLWSTIVTSGFAIFQEAVGSYTSLWFYLNPPGQSPVEWEGRATSVLNYPNSLAGYLNLVIPLALGCFVLGRDKWKKLSAWTLALGVVALICTQSLGGLAAFGCIIILAIFCFVEDWEKRILFFAGTFTLGLGLYIARETINPAHVDALVGYDSIGRVLLWGVAWNFFLHSPIIGVGWGNFRWLYGSELHFSWITPDTLDVHNIYLQLLAETGIVGFLAFFSLIFATLKVARTRLRSTHNYLSRSIAFGVIGAILGMLTHGLVDFLFRVSPQFGTLFWMLLALLVVSIRLDEAEFCVAPTIDVQVT